MYGSGRDNKTTLINTVTENDSLLQETTCKKKHGLLFWRELGWRVGLAILFSVSIIVTLYAFSRKKHLSRWDKRWFNVLTIFFSSLVSLIMGSLLGLLGSMLRWRLLASRSHTPIDVDLVLGIGNPTGALKLIWHHTKDRRWSMTTVIVTTYLIVNISVRLSVASFGLTYDVNELPGIKYPVTLTNWSSGNWFNISEGETDHYRMISDHGITGLQLASTEIDTKDPATFTQTNISGLGLDRKVEGDKVTYTYSLKDYQGKDVYPAAKNRLLHSSSSCVGSMMWGSDIFTNGELVGNVNETDQTSPNLLHMLVALFSQYPNAETNYIWMSQLGVDDPAGLGCATTYIYKEDEQDFVLDDKYIRNSTIWECTTCLSDTNNVPGLGTDVLFGQAPEDAPTIASLLLQFGAFERKYIDYSNSGRENFVARLYSSQNIYDHFLNDRFSQLESGATKDAPRVNVPAEVELYASHLAARLPLLAIIGADGADSTLEKVTRDGNASEHPYITVLLDVKWSRAITVLIGLFIGQVVIIAVVKWMCRNVFLRDNDSFISVARVLRTAMSEVDGRSTEDGKALAVFLEKTLQKERGDARLRYGTRNRGGEYLEADIWYDVDNNFPPAIYG